MKDLSEIGKKLKDIDGLKQAAQSPEGQKLLQNVDTAALEKAARSGDMDAMKGMLSQILASPEGKALARQVQDAVKHKKG